MSCNMKVTTPQPPPWTKGYGAIAEFAEGVGCATPSGLRDLASFRGGRWAMDWATRTRLPVFAVLQPAIILDSRICGQD